MDEQRFEAVVQAKPLTIHFLPVTGLGVSNILECGECAAIVRKERAQDHVDYHARTVIATMTEKAHDA